MRVALQDNIVKEKYGTSVSYSIPPPLGGLNTRDSVATMDEADALMLDNWVVRLGECQLRGGSILHIPSITPCKTIFQYPYLGGNKKLFFSNDVAVFDMTSAGAVTFALAATNGYWNGLLITNSAGTTYWWMCNGTDAAALYDGTTWSAPAITGIATTSLVFPWLFKRRLFAIEKNSMNAWFLTPDAIQGAAEKYPFGSLFKKGGYLVAGTNWTLDSGSGPDDLFVIITSEGELAVYQGTDPKSASAWSIVGVYDVGKPLGRRCFSKISGDVAVIVESGVYLLSKLLSSGEVNFASALTNKVQPSFTTDADAFGELEGWEFTLYPKYDAALLNVPDPSGSRQYVLNTVTGAWSTFSGWDASCFFNFNNVMYFGREDAVLRAWDGELVSDRGQDIVGSVKMAYNYFTKRAILKHIELLRPQLAYNGSIETRLGVSADFTATTFGSILSRRASVIGASWDVDAWDSSAWAVQAYRIKAWQNVRHPPGYALSLWLQTASNDSKLSWSGTDVILATGGLL